MIRMKKLDDAHTFCRSLYQEIAKEFTGEFLKALWARKNEKIWEVHGEHNFYWYGQADCSWSAKAKALEELSRRMN